MDRRGKNNAEILITGAGPTGLMMACQLSQYNIPFRIIDKKKHPSTQSGAMILHARSLEYFQQLNLVEEIMAQGTILTGLTVSFNDKKRLRLSLNDKKLRQSGFPFVCMLEQSKTEQLLIDYLERRGYRVEWETELVSLVQSANEVEAGLLLGDGTPDVVTVKYVAGADGGKSTVRDLLKIPFKGKTHSSSLTIMECDANIQMPHGEVLFSFSKEATTGFFPLPGGKWRIDAAFRKVNKRLLPLNFEKVQAIFNRKSGVEANLRNGMWFSKFYSHGRHAAHFMSNRCFLVGDAAHLFTPVGGQGMNTGLQDACNLAWKLALVVKKRTAPWILSTYEEERKPVAIKTCHWSDYFFKVTAPKKIFVATLYTKLLPPVLTILFKLMQTKKGADFVFEKVSGIGVSYGSNSLNQDVTDSFIISAPKPGDRMPYIPYKANGKEISLYHKVRNDRFLLLAFGDSNNAGKLTKAVKPYKDVLITEVIPFNRETSVLYLHFGIKSQGWYLIRPDMHIASRWDGAGDVELKACLNTLFTGNE